MKHNDAGDFCILYIEPADEKAELFALISTQTKPVVLMLADQTRVLQRPEDFMELKHVKRHIAVPIVFVATHSERLQHLATRSGFPVYPSMDALAESLLKGQRTRQLSKATIQLDPIRTADLQPKTQPLQAAQFTQATQSTQPIRHAPSIQQTERSQTTEPMHGADLVSHQPTEPIVRQRRERKKKLPLILVVLTVTALVAASLGTFLVFVPNVPMRVEGNGLIAPPAVGHLYFLSSQQLSENSNRGIDDKIQIDLHNLTSPSAGKSYYAWLLSDKSQADMKATLLGVLPVNNGNVHFLYAGDAQHTNLLAIASRLLVTEENAAVAPLTPSPDEGLWRYYGEFSTTPIVGNNDGANGTTSPKTFSYLDHLRHVLASDPLLNEMELPGGLSNWLFKNTGKILEWTGGMREQWEETPDMSFIRRQTVRTLTYLDGLSFVQQDVPPLIPLGINDRLGRIGLLPVNGIAQDPPAYLSHIAFHLNGLLQANPTNMSLRTHIAALIVALNNARFWLMQVRKDAQQLMKMSDNQLRQPATLALLNDMIANANYAYVGQTDTTTGQVQQGITWVHNELQSLAVFPVMRYMANHSSIQMINDAKHVRGARFIQGGTNE